MITKFKVFENRTSIGKKMTLTKDIIDLYNIFKSKNFDLLVVGGAVRDFIKNQEPHDIDLVTNAKPDEIINLLKNKYRVDLQGKQFGVIRVFTNETPLGIEIASYRKDIAKGRDNKGDNQKVDIETANIYSDSERRDLRQNALYYDIGSGEIVDLVGGIEDIDKNIISAVGEASERFIEDRLRILRVFRFASRNHSEISKNTIDAIMKDKRLRNISPIDDVSQERIVEEFQKSVDWSLDHNKIEALQYYLELLDKYGMFEEMFPELDINIEGIDTFNLIIIFTLLFRDNDVETLKVKLKKCKFPNILANTVCFLLSLSNDIRDLNKIPALYKDKVRFHVDNETIEEFADLYDFNDNYLQAFLKFQPKIDTTEINLLFKGAERGMEVKRQEIEEFKRLL